MDSGRQRGRIGMMVTEKEGEEIIRRLRAISGTATTLRTKEQVRLITCLLRRAERRADKENEKLF